ncbi:MAG: hypothetical protein HY043_18100 [Verrucomicrobia bacterium]|nr:hypothetical protein [Verrucomicrobiota bacterium]
MERRGQHQRDGVKAMNFNGLLGIASLAVIAVATGCTVVKVYPQHPGDEAKVYRNFGFIWLEFPNSQSGIYLESRGAGFTKLFDGIMMGYHETRAVIGIPINSVVIFGKGATREDRFLLTNLTTINNTKP